MKFIAAFAVACMFGLPTVADVNVEFLEGAPKDKFILTNVGICDLTDLEVTLDLTGSTSGLIFDVTDGGPGVEVFQPFQVVSGQGLLAGTPNVADGDKSVTLLLKTFGQGQSVAFTIDVDDTSGTREITVSKGEICGATVIIATSTEKFFGSFDGYSKTIVSIPGCAA
jgi:hypothetical protein